MSDETFSFPFCYDRLLEGERIIFCSLPFSPTNLIAVSHTVPFAETAECSLGNWQVHELSHVHHRTSAGCLRAFVFMHTSHFSFQIIAVVIPLSLACVSPRFKLVSYCQCRLPFH